MLNLSGRASVCAAVLGVLSAGVEASPDSVQQSRPRIVHATVMANDGSPVTDLTAEDFDVREGGRARPVVSATIATSPIRVALLVADGGSGAFQSGAGYFIRDLLPPGSIALFSVFVQPERLVDYTNDSNALRAGVSRLGIRGRTEGGAQLMEAILTAAREVKGEAERSALVVCRIGGESQTTMRAQEIRTELIRRGTVLYVLSTAGPGNVAADDDSAFQLQLVLGDGSRESGGRHDQAVGNLVPAMRQIARELGHQYRIVYELPAGVKPSDRVSVTVNRKDLRIQAPSRISAE